MPLLKNTRLQQVASNPSHHCWVSASAGSGKTKVLIDRIMRLLLDEVAPEKILGLTFTKAAAAEMENRLSSRLKTWFTCTEETLHQELEALLGQSPFPSTLVKARALYPTLLTAGQPLKIQTIHSFCNTLLLQFPLEAGISPRFRLIEETEREELLKTACHRLFQELEEVTDIANHMTFTRFFDLFSHLLQQSLPWHASSSSMFSSPHVEKTHIFKKLAIKGRQIFEELKEKQGVVDFGDLIAKSLELLSHSSGAVAYKFSQKISHILIDEAQDNSRQQWEFIRLLCGEWLANSTDTTLFVVGDLKQSIYSFQGADPLQFLETRAYFRQLSQRPFQEIDFSLSYRSTPAVLQVVDAVFQDPTLKEGLTLWNSEAAIFHQASREAVGRVELWPCVEKEKGKTEEAEEKLALVIFEKIAHLLKARTILPSTNKPCEPRDFLILLRRRSGLLQALLKAATTFNIPISGADRFVLNEELLIKDVLALAQSLLFPFDDLMLASVLKGPFFALSEEALFQLCYARSHSLWERFSSPLNPPELQQAHQKFEKYRALAQQHLPFEFFSRLFGETRPLLQKAFGNKADFLLEELLVSVQAFEEKKISSLPLYLNFISKNPILVKKEISGSFNEVKMMTVHGSKGLEAPVVILADAMDSEISKIDPFLWHFDNQIPILLLRPNQQEEDEATRRLKQHKHAQEIKEQARLLYVALTRAKDQLLVFGLNRFPKAKEPKKTWYHSIQQALEKIGTPHYFTQEFLSGNGFIYPSLAAASEKDWPNQIPEEKAITPPPLPPFFYEDFPADLPPPLPLATLASSTDSLAANRGTVLHFLLEMLPTVLLPTDSWQKRLEKAAKIAQENFSSILLNSLLVEDIEAVLRLLEHPDLQMLWGEKALAEVSLFSPSRQKTVRLDRLVFQQDFILVADYKTTPTPPTTPEEVAPSMRAQLMEYKEILQEIYRNKPVRCCFIWLHARHNPLMEI